MRIPRPLRVVTQGILVFFAIIGGVLSLGQLPAAWQPNDARTIILKTDDALLVTQGVFAPLLKFEDEPIGSSQVVETTITLWRDGGAPITNEMVRRSLEFRMPPGSRVAAVKLVAQESSIPDNFALSSTGSSVTITWRVFDPDMAVKIAIARFGNLDPLVNADNLGPGVIVTSNRYNTAKSIYFWGVAALIIAVFGAVLISAITFGGDAAFERVGKMLGYLPRPLKPLFAVLGGAIYMGFLIGFTLAGLRVIPWLLTVVVPPVPFT